MRFRLLPAALALLLPAVAQATPITFTTRSQFNAATMNRTVESFDTLGGQQCLPVVPGTDPCVLTIGAVTYTATRPIFGPFAARPELQPELGGLRTNSTPIDDDDFTADFAASAVALDVLSNGGVNPIMRIVLTEIGGATFSYDVTSGLSPGVFFGATSTVGFTRLALFSSPLDCCTPPRMDDFTLGTRAVPAAVPEPVSLVLLGSGLIGAAIHHRRRRGVAGAS